VLVIAFSKDPLIFTRMYRKGREKPFRPTGNDSFPDAENNN